MTHICVSQLTIIGSDNGLSPGRCQVIIWTNAVILLIGSLETNFSEILIGIQTFSFKKMQLKCRLRNGIHFVSASVCYHWYSHIWKRRSLYWDGALIYKWVTVTWQGWECTTRTVVPTMTSNSQLIQLHHTVYIISLTITMSVLISWCGICCAISSF